MLKQICKQGNHTNKRSDIDIQSSAFTSNVKNGSKVGSGSAEFRTFTFDASKNNTEPIYSKSSTVQSTAIKVNIWQRTA